MTNVTAKIAKDVRHKSKRQDDRLVFLDGIAKDVSFCPESSLIHIKPSAATILGKDLH